MPGERLTPARLVRMLFGRAPGTGVVLFEPGPDDYAVFDAPMFSFHTGAHLWRGVGLRPGRGEAPVARRLSRALSRVTATA